MSSTREGTIPLAQLVEQAWDEVQGQVRALLKRAIEALLEAERDRRRAERQQAGEKVYR